MEKVYKSNSVKETQRIGEEIASLVCPGCVILLEGDLGAGKTAISNGIVKALTKKEYLVTSPTFAIVNEYNGVIKVNHFDFYRIESVDELENIGIYEYLYDDNSVSIIEWPNRADEILDGLENVINIHIKKIDDTKREIKVVKK